jgi:enoyl-CoA hydratase/carnithine racemase
MSDLITDVAGGVARFTINRPDAMNAMTRHMWGGLADELRAVENNRDVRVVLITGAGNNFCAGGDVKEFSTTLGLDTAERAQFWMESGDKGNALFNVIERLPQPVVARVRGMAAGGGMAIVAAADLAIASDSARFIAAQIKIGAIPDSALSYNMVRGVGPKRAKQYCFLGDVLDAQTAENIGLLNWVLPDAELDTATDALLARLVKLPREALARTKRAMNTAHRISVADHLAQETLDIGACVSEPDFLQRVSAFVTRTR